MDFLNTLAQIRTPALEKISSFITFFGEEVFLLIIAMIVFWCYEKKKGYRLLVIALVGLSLNMLIKTICAVPRPWVIQPGISVASAIPTATGYSFPSGHTQSAAMIFFTMASFTKKKWPWAVAAVAAALVGFSRMMLGVHTPEDVCVGYVLGLATVLGCNFLMDHRGKSGRNALLAVAGAFTAAAILYTSFGPRSSGVMDDSDLTGLKDLWTITGVLVSMCLGLLLDKKQQMEENPPAVWWIQLLKIVGGFVLVMGVRVLLKAILPSAPWASGIRYLFVGIVGIILWPRTFHWWNHLCRAEKS